MPGRDGFQSCRELRALPAYSGVPAVFVSSASPEAAPGGEAVDFIRKDGEMLDRLGRWLDDRFVPAA